MEHLALEIFDITTGWSTGSITNLGSQFACLPEDADITIIDTSEIFASGDVWSYSFTLNIPANTHIFGSAGDMHGGRLHEQVNKRRARLWVDGVPMYLGYLDLEDEAEVDEHGNVEVTLQSGQHTFDEMISDAKANQVPMMSDVKFGVALWRKRWVHMAMKLEASAVFKNKNVSESGTIIHTVHESEIGDEDQQLTCFSYDGESDGNSVQQYPRMVFPKGKFDNLKNGVKNEEVDCLNTDYPYDDEHPYCNVALCYQKYGYTVTKEENGTKITYEDYTSDPTAEREYEVMPANRVNSAPSFYVIYWIRSLMKHLGIHIEENQMMDVEDLRRLFFMNTKCAYREIDKLRTTQEYDWSLGKYQFGENGNLVAEYFGELKNEYYTVDTKRYNGIKQLAKPENCGLETVGYTIGPWMEDVNDEWGRYQRDVSDLVPDIERMDIKVKAIAGMSERVRAYYDGNNGESKSLARNMFLHDAIATSECFPDVDIRDVISAIENGFGVRFLFDENYQRVRIVLLRNIFRSKDAQDIHCEIMSESKVENSLRGFRMTYDETEDTHFFYKGFDDKLPKKAPYFVDDSDKHDYSHWDLNADYGRVIHKVTAFDKTCYVDPKTGNAYVIKVDKDAKRYDDLHPSLFEGAGFMDAEDGDCTGDDETIHTIRMGFTPLIMNDVNFKNERDGDKGQRFAAIVEDAVMRPRRPDLKDLPDEEKQPGVKSYDDADAFYSVDELFRKHGPNGSERMVSDSVVAPGSFAITSDMYAEKSGLRTTLKYTWVTLGQHGVVTRTATSQVTDLHIAGHINEGYRLYLQDNYEPNDDGVSPIEAHDWGLTLGIMRGSGGDAFVDYSNDPDDGEGNDTWDIVPGSNVTAHPDTCDSYGDEWDYNGEVRIGKDGAVRALNDMFPNSNAPFYVQGRGYLVHYSLHSVTDGNGVRHWVLLASKYSDDQDWQWPFSYVSWLESQLRTSPTGGNIQEIYAFDRIGDGEDSNRVIEVGTAYERAITMLQLCRLAYDDNETEPVIIDNGIGSRYGRVSLKLRAEKPNPFFDPKKQEDDNNRRYLDISSKNLKGRGLADQFYKEYSYWLRNARIWKGNVKMDLATLRSIDKTRRVTVGDVTGFVRKMKYNVSNKTGIGLVTMEIMYI